MLLVFEHANAYSIHVFLSIRIDWTVQTTKLDIIFAPWIHDFLTHSWTTNYAEENTEDMNCDPLRGDPEQEVYHMNNWLRGPLGLSDPTRGEEANNVEFLVERATECWLQHGKRPTFIAVDWWEDGDVVAAAVAINQLNQPA